MSSKAISDSTPPIQLSRSTKISAPVTIIVSFTALVAGAAMAYAGLISTSDRLDASLKDEKAQCAKREDRIARLEQSLSKIEVMQNDISWIRRSLEERNIKPPTKIYP